MKEERERAGKGKSTSAGLLEIIIDQLPMLTEKGLREMMVPSHVNCHSGATFVKRSNWHMKQVVEKVWLPAGRASGNRRSRGSSGGEHEEARGVRGEESGR